jgi:putative heme-binding domain-containing protein
MWTVRLIGDQAEVSGDLGAAVSQVAKTEQDAEVISQLAATAKRMPVEHGLNIFKALAMHIEPSDPDNPLLLWWALEAKVDGNQALIAQIFAESDLWKSPVISTTILERLMQRLMMQGKPADYELATALFDQAPTISTAKILMNGFTKGLRGGNVLDLPNQLLEAIHPYMEGLGGGPLALDLRRREPEAIEKAVAIIQDPQALISERLGYIQIAGEVSLPGMIEPLLKVTESRNSPPAILKTALRSLSSYGDNTIGERLLNAYPNHLRADQDVRESTLYVLTSRGAWSSQLMNRIHLAKEIHASDLPHSIVRRLSAQLPEKAALLLRHWPLFSESSPSDKDHEIARIIEVMQNGQGDSRRGQVLFNTFCGNCHQLFDQGQYLGPDLTGYDRKNLSYLVLQIVDPNLDIREGFVNYALHGRDGRFLTGIIKNRSGKEVVIQPLTGDEIALPTSAIDSLIPQSQSIMPEGLLTPLPDQDIRDLFAYIMGDEPS